MKRLSAIFVMLLFMFSMVPVAFAEQASTTDVRSALIMGADSNISLRDKIKEGIEESTTIIQERVEACVSTNMENRGMSEDEARTLCIREGINKIDETVRTRFRQLSERFNSLSEEQKSKVMTLTRAQINKLEGFDEEKIRERVSEMKVVRVKAENLYRNREIAKEKIQEAESRYNEARNMYQKAREEFPGLKNRFQESVRSGTEEEQTTAAKEYLSKSADMIILHLEQVKEKVAANDDLEEDEASAMVTQIDEKISELKVSKEELDASETKDDVKEVAAKINAQWKSVKDGSKKVVGRVIATKVGEIIKRSEQLEVRAEKALQEIAEKGIEITDLDAKIESFSAKVEDARERYDNAKALYAQAKEVEDVSTVIQEAHEELKEAHELLKEAHQIYIELFKALKQNGAELKEENEVTDVVDELEEAQEEQAEVEDVFEEVDE